MDSEVFDGSNYHGKLLVHSIFDHGDPFIQQGHLTPVNIKYVNIFTDKHFSVSTIRRKKWKSVIPP